ncbi:MAG: ribosome maturation factor RimM [Oscillospiraceae bacterium]
MQKEFLEAGKIVNVHALKGEVKVMPWCDSAEFLCEFERLFLDAGEQELEIQRARVFKNMAIIKFAGIDTVEQAEKLRNKILYMWREDIELDEDCYFIQDLIGLEVSDADTGEIYGKLNDVMQTGANDVYVIKGKDREYLIPAIPDVIISTDIENGTMTIRPLDGLFDD